MKGRRYTQEFKEEAINLALSSSEDLGVLASRLDIGYSTLRKWVGDRVRPAQGGSESMKR